MVKVNFEIDDDLHEFGIPERWEEVNVEQFMRIMALNNDKEGKTDIGLSMEIISILTGLALDLVYMIPITDFNQIQSVLDFTKEQVNSPLKDFVIVDDEEYFFKNDFNNLTMGEVITLETILGQDSNPYNSFDKLLCIFLRKKTKKGNLETFKTTFMERADMFKKITIADVYSLMVFFSGGETTLENNMKDSLENQK
jgi:hypothetical protein